MSTVPPAMRGLPSRSVAFVTKELFPALMQGEFDCNRRVPEANSGSAVQQWFRVLPDVPSRTMQLLSVPHKAPAASPAELPVSVQLFKMEPDAPPPWVAELPLSVQLFSVPPTAPPP